MHGRDSGSHCRQLHSPGRPRTQWLINVTTVRERSQSAGGKRGGDPAATTRRREERLRGAFALLLVFVSAPRLFFIPRYFYLITSYHLASCFCRHSAPPALSLPPSLSLSLSPILTPDDAECRSPCLEEPPPPLSFSPSLCLSVHPLHRTLLHWGWGSSGLLACCWTAPLAGYHTRLDMIYSAHEVRRSPISVTRPAASISWDESGRHRMPRRWLARDWRAGRDRAHEVREEFPKRSGEEPPACFPRYRLHPVKKNKKIKNEKNKNARSQNPSHRSKSLLRLPSISRIFPGSMCCISPCFNDDAPNLFETTFSTERRNP